MRSGRSRYALGLVVVVVGLALAALTFVVGWELPREVDCGGGDACVERAAIDWDRVDWSVRPTQVACRVQHPGREFVLMRPGDVCVTSGGGQETRETYEQVRDAFAVRRAVTLAAAGILVVAALAGGHVVARGRPRRRTT